MYAIIFHAHQKLDKVAYKHLKTLTPKGFFPDIDKIIHFDGVNGPDSPKLKKQINIEQPWHFINPLDNKDDKLQKDIDFHYKQLVAFLKKKDEIHSAFEAAWLAHAIVDGLTPAHHYPYEQELEKLRGECHQTRKGLIGRMYIKGETLTQSIIKSIKLIGPKGLLTAHTMFEAGAYFIIAPLRLKYALPTPDDVAKVDNNGLTNVFKEIAREIAGYDIYTRFLVNGWTNSLSQDVRLQMAPRMARMITLAWYSACQEAAA